jgi:hypothetical protein
VPLTRFHLQECNYRKGHRKRALLKGEVMVHRFGYDANKAFRSAEEALAVSLTSVLGLKEPARLAICHRYDIEGMSDQEAA